MKFKINEHPIFHQSTDIDINENRWNHSSSFYY
jgi:hypothetical protein